jgi:hypothetical protein
MTGDPPAEGFDYSQSFEIDGGRAATIADFLRRSGYSGCFADEVTAELARPERERSVIGLVAADLLRGARWRP